jgi:hypothetical protein
MPRCGHESLIANDAPSSVRPKTSGTSSSIAFARPRPRISELLAAGYQKSHKNPASSPRAAPRELSRSSVGFSSIDMRSASLMAADAS